jgi:hypothetical protein
MAAAQKDSQKVVKEPESREQATKKPSSNAAVGFVLRDSFLRSDKFAQSE